MSGWEPVFLGDDYRRPIGAYSPAVRAGDFVFASGQVPRDLRTGDLMGDDVESQTRAVIENLRTVLAAAGATLADVVSVGAFLTDMSQWDKFDAVYRAEFQPPYPTRTTVGAQLHGVLVEINAIARVR